MGKNANNSGKAKPNGGKDRQQLASKKDEQRRDQRIKDNQQTAQDADPRRGKR
jgi:hypothetical protein